MKKNILFSLWCLFTIVFVSPVSAESQNIENFLKEQAKQSDLSQSQSQAGTRFLLDSLFAYRFGTTYGSDCWGYTAPGGQQYALFGIEHGVVAVNATTLQIVDTITGVNCLWQDIKTYDHYAYAVSECGSGLRVIDLQYLPDSLHLAAILSTSGGGAMSSHNIAVDSVKGFLYAEGSSGVGNNIHIFDLSNPEIPVYVSSFGFSPADIHDMYALNDTVYIAEGNEGSISIMDMTDKLNGQRIGYARIPNSGYVHNIWPTADKSHVVTTEETTGKTVKIWNIEDFADIQLVGEYIAPNQLAHNAHVLGNYVYLSHYSSGVRVIDISIPGCPIEAAVYDKSGDNTWGCFPFTGNDSLVYSSNMDGTMYIFKLIPNPAFVADDPDTDGIESVCDNCPTVANVSQIDSDQDSYGDECDNCPTIDNVDQTDTDGDNVGNVCDICSGFDDNIDTDSDGVPNGCDSCSGFDDNTDTDTDGIPDGCDMCAGFDDNIDTDTDGFPDGCDICPTVFDPGQEDLNNDLVGDACCCVGSTGDVNGSGNPNTDILDLNYLVNYIFRSGPPSVCVSEGDVNKDGQSSNILDLNYIINYIFRSGPTPLGC